MATEGDQQPIQVFVRVTFLKIGEIDTVKECFTAEALIQSKWREQSLDGRMELNLKEIPVNDYWNPKLYVDNTVGEAKESVTQTVVFNRKQEAYICSQKRIKGGFMENLELQEFPFDTQDITLTVVSELSIEEAELVDDPAEISTINVSSFVDAQEWELYNYVDVSHTTIQKMIGGSGGKEYPAVAFKCRASRRYGYFIWNIFFVMLFICCMGFTTFAVDYKLPQNRLQLTFILLLTTVAFRTNVNNSLPRISYLTYMDKYILGLWALQCIICAVHAFVGTVIVELPKIAYWADKGSLICLFTLFVLIQIVFALFIRNKVGNKKREFHLKEQQQKKQGELNTHGDFSSTTSLVIDAPRGKGKRSSVESTPLRSDLQKAPSSYRTTSTQSSRTDDK
jgi:hypothetical protein